MKYTKTEYLMGTNIKITIISDKNPLEDFYDSFGVFYSLEKEFSRFSSNSDLSLLNKNRKGEVSNRFIDVLNKSVNIFNKTDGFFNPLINLNNIGYSSDFKEGNFEIKKTNQDLDFTKIEINLNTISLKENQNIDFGGIVKGYGVDLISKFLKDKGYKDFIINAGGDIYLSGNNIGKKWVIAIDNPFNNEYIFATLELANKAISTSGTYKRKWNIDKKEFHHILDPKTNTNKNEIISISIISDNVYVSDSYATACIAMGIEKSLKFLEKYNIDGIIIGNDGNIYKTKGMDNYNLNII